MLQFPPHPRKIDLKREGLYPLVFSFLRRLWQDELLLITDSSDRDIEGSPFVGRSVFSYSHAVLAGMRYGTSTHHRGRNHQYAYMNGREAVQINHILQISHRCLDGKILVASLAIVQPFLPSNQADQMPWAMRCVACCTLRDITLIIFLQGY
ncbi:hypothetical protein C2E23DRAFT_724308 [Lenzites betulinus]|nr:hypothetical protein C2E23DRAFT_724308 [Lenzites betulinus]